MVRAVKGKALQQRLMHVLWPRKLAQHVKQALWGELCCIAHSSMY